MRASRARYPSAAQLIHELPSDVGISLHDEDRGGTFQRCPDRRSKLDLAGADAEALARNQSEHLAVDPGRGLPSPPLSGEMPTRRESQLVSPLELPFCRRACIRPQPKGDLAEAQPLGAASRRAPPGEAPVEDDPARVDAPQLGAQHRH